jgi:hypothetical protein
VNNGPAARFLISLVITTFLSEKDCGVVPHNMMLITQKRRYIYKREGGEKNH